MARTKTSLKDQQVQAHDWFMRSDKTLKEISALVKVPYDTVCSWAKKGRWKELKSANSVTRQQSISNILLQMKELQDEIKTREKKYPTYKEQMIISMMVDDIRKLDKSLSLPDYITFSTELMKFLNAHKPDVAKQAADLVMEFVQDKASQLNA